MLKTLGQDGPTTCNLMHDSSQVAIQRNTKLISHLPLVSLRSRCSPPRRRCGSCWTLLHTHLAWKKSPKEATNRGLQMADPAAGLMACSSRPHPQIDDEFLTIGAESLYICIRNLLHQITDILLVDYDIV